MSRKPRAGALRKELGLFDVYAISTGAMFSSGFFLLPGIAAAQTGPSVALAYLTAGLFILPAMFSVAELATAMPRAGGAYYFLDRSMGPLVGTVGGLGTWSALVLKSAFALVGMGAYLALYVDVPIQPLAIALTIAFAVLNIVGAKETSRLQAALVSALLVILFFFIVQGAIEVAGRGVGIVASERFTPFTTAGLTGFFGTVGLVFVSYAGLTKVASVAEEIRDPDRNIPLGMILSLVTAAASYTVGVMIIVAVLPPEQLHGDLTPVATAAAAFFDWLPAGMGVGLIVAAAVAAFASTANAGILSASRYPLAMARDRLVSVRLAHLGRFGTPTPAIVLTSGLVVACILFLDVEGIAKLASAFQLLLFSLLSLAVVIMRESGIEGYDPGYRSPLYPWMQIAGFLAPFWLIAEMGQIAIIFTLGLIAAAVGWYIRYARPRVVREGAIFHAFARLGERRYDGLDLELRGIVGEKGLREGDPFDQIVARARVLDYEGPTSVHGMLHDASRMLADMAGIPTDKLAGGLIQQAEAGFVPIARGVALPHVRVEGLNRTAMLLVRCRAGISGATDGDGAGGWRGVRAALVVVSPGDRPGQHLRLLGHLAGHADDPAFLEAWLGAQGESELKATLLREERFSTLRVAAGLPTASWAGRPLQALELPHGTLVAVVRREAGAFVPDGSSVLEAGDHLTVIGSPEGILEVTKQFGSARPDAGKEVISRAVSATGVGSLPGG